MQYSDNQLGKQFFKSFLLAGERFLVEGRNRPGDEARFEEFYNKLSTGEKSAAKAYFIAQSRMSGAQRSEVLGTFTTLPVNSNLNLFTSLSPLMRQRAFRDRYLGLFPEFSFIGGGGVAAPAEVAGSVGDGHDIIGLPRFTVQPFGSPKVDSISLVLDSVTVVKSEDYSWFEWWNKTDEVALGIVAFHTDGRVKYGKITVGNIKEGKTKNFDNKKIVTYDVPKPGNIFPWLYQVEVIPTELDEGGLIDLLEKLGKFLEDKITEEKIANGIEVGGASIGIPIPASIADHIAGWIDGFVDDALEWLKGFFVKGRDDVMGKRFATVKVRNSAPIFVSNDAEAKKDGDIADSEPFDWRFSGGGGVWDIRMHWSLEAKNAHGGSQGTIAVEPS